MLFSFKFYWSLSVKVQLSMRWVNGLVRDKPLPEPMIICPLTHICVAPPQCVKYDFVKSTALYSKQVLVCCGPMNHINNFKRFPSLQERILAESLQTITPGLSRMPEAAFQKIICNLSTQYVFVAGKAVYVAIKIGFWKWFHWNFTKSTFSGFMNDYDRWSRCDQGISSINMRITVSKLKKIFTGPKYKLLSSFTLNVDVYMSFIWNKLHLLPWVFKSSQ